MQVSTVDAHKHRNPSAGPRTMHPQPRMQCTIYPSPVPHESSRIQLQPLKQHVNLPQEDLVVQRVLRELVARNLAVQRPDHALRPRHGLLRDLISMAIRDG